MKALNHPATFYVVRHGETTWNVERKLQGHKDSPLTALGINQARELSNSLADVHFDIAFSSDTSRATRTAELILLEKKIALETTALLRERFFGRWEGKTYDEYNSELKIDFDKLEKLTHSERQVYKPAPDVENDEQIVGRFLTFIREASVAYPDKTILIVSHGGIMRATLVHLGVGTYSQLRMGAIENSGYFILKSDGVEFEIRHLHNIQIHKP